MKLTLTRYSESKESTLGLLHIDGVFQCYILEDQYQTKKVFGETRIPNGVYDLKLREYGGHHGRYKEKFPLFHLGMIQIMDVPNFRDILIHIGNKDDDTQGCLLTGNMANNNRIGDGFLQQSTDAYVAMYKKVAPVLFSGETIKIYIYNIFDQL